MTLPARATSTFIFLSLYRASYPLFGREEGRVRTCSTLVFFFSFFFVTDLKGSYCYLCSFKLITSNTSICCLLTLHNWIII